MSPGPFSPHEVGDTEALLLVACLVAGVVLLLVEWWRQSR